jgi:acetylornithine/succinyldiaminopimelate/putrescine aminotransferase
MNNRELFFKNLAQTSPFPLAFEITKAEGCYMYGPNGEKYLDLISGIAVSNIGHRHPHVISKIKEQLDKYMHLMVYGEIVQAPQVQLAKKLGELLPWKDKTQTYLVNSGSEAIEGAIKLAKRYTGKTKLISCKNAYHGSTHGALSLMGNELFKESFRPLLPGITHIQYGNTNDLSWIDKNTAAIVIEPIQGEAGVKIASKNYFNELMNKCKQTGTLIIADEIQSGFGRTGNWFAFEKVGLIPDIVVMAKGMGGGLPIGAFASDVDVMNCLTNNPILGHITTFGGHPVCSVAALASIEVIANEKLLINVIERSAQFKKNLIHPAIKEIRGEGLMLAVELDCFENVQKVIEYCLGKGLFTDWFLFCDNSIRVAPPLIISEEETDFAINTLLEVLNKVYSL